MVDLPLVIPKFWEILESRFSKVRLFFSNFLKSGSFFQIFLDFIVIWGFLIELMQNIDWHLLLLERRKRLKSRQFALRDLLISCQFYGRKSADPHLLTLPGFLRQ